MSSSLAALLAAVSAIAHAQLAWSDQTHQIAFGDFNGDGVWRTRSGPPETTIVRGAAIVGDVTYSRTYCTRTGAQLHRLQDVMN